MEGHGDGKAVSKFAFLRRGQPGLVRAIAVLVLWTLLLILYTYQVSWRPPWPGASMPEEDAFISFRFAENIAEGHGPVFNQAGEPVEGYTNFLWVMWLAALHGQWPDTVIHALWSGWVLGFLCLVASYLLARRVCPRLAWCVPVLVAVSAYHTDNALTGMETMAYNFLFLLAAALFAVVLEAPRGRCRNWAAATTSGLLLLASLTRFEGVYLFGLFSLFWAWRRRGDRESLVRDWAWHLPFAVGYSAYTAWRLAFFGELLPATYWAKLVVTGTGWAKVILGFDYVVAFLVRYPSLVVMVFAFGIVAPWRKQRLFQLFLLTTVVAQLSLVAFVGGDWVYLAGYWRLLSTIAPVFLVLGLGVVEHSLFRGRRWPGLLILGCCFGLSMIDLRAAPMFQGPGSHRPASNPSFQASLSQISRLPQELGPRLRWLLEYQDSHPERAIGEWLRGNYGPDGRVAGQHAGRIPYYSRLQFIDPIGFTDSGIKKIRWDQRTDTPEKARWPKVWEYLLVPRPDAVLVLNKGGDTEVYQALVEAINRHDYCLGNSVGVHNRRISFLVFMPAGDGCPDDSCQESVEIAGTAFRLCRESKVWLGENG